MTWLPGPADKTPRIFFAIPSNDESQLEPGMHGIKDAASGRKELWFRPPRVSQGDAAPDPVLVANGADAISTFLGLTDAPSSYSDKAGNYPSVNSGETGLEFNDGLEVLNTEETGSTDNFTARERDITVLRTETITDIGSVDSAASDQNFIYVLGNDDYITRYDRYTFEQLQRYSDSAGWGGRTLLTCDVCPKLLWLDDNTIIEFNKNDLEDYSSITATNLDAYVMRGCAVHPTTGDVYNVKSSDYKLQIAVRGATTYTVTDYTLAGFTGLIRGIFFSADGLYFYLVDLDSPSTYIRKYDTATRTLQTSSPAITSTTYDNDILPTWHNDKVMLFIADKAYLLNGDTLALRSGPGSTSIAGDATSPRDGVIYSVEHDTIRVYQNPALTLRAPEFEVSNGETEYSSPSVRDENDKPWKYSKSDVARAMLAARSLPRRLAGMSIESVETTLPAQNYDDKFYLISGGTTIYEGSILHDRQDGWVFYTPYEGAELHDKERSTWMHYTGGSWKTRVSIILTGETETSSITSDSDTLTIDGTNYLRLNNQELLSAEIKVTGSLDPTSSWQPATGSPIAAKWEWNGYIAYDSVAGRMSGNPSPFTSIADTSSVADTPTINTGSSSATGDIIITVQHTQTIATQTKFFWRAEIIGILQPCHLDVSA